MDDSQLLRYSRHILLDDIGIEGQEAFLNAHALVIGAGGLGSPVAMYLAASGVGTITLVDDDVVELTNLQRQIGHTTDRLGMSKVQSLAQSLQALNPTILVHQVQARADAQTLQGLVAQATVVLDCCDNYRTRQAVNAACVQARVPLVSGAAIRWDGQISVFDARQAQAPCYACLFSPEETFEEVQCSTMGVVAPMVGIVGSVQAAEALKLIAQVGKSLAGRLLLLDGRAMQWSSMRTAKNPECLVCSSGNKE